MHDFNSKRVFLSGPMSGKPDWNREAFAQAEKRCYELGADWVYNPAKDAPREGEPVAEHEQYMNVTLHELTRWVNGAHSIVDSRPFYDVLVLLDGWEKSDGALMESSTAFECGIPYVLAGEVL